MTVPVHVLETAMSVEVDDPELEDVVAHLLAACAGGSRSRITAEVRATGSEPWQVSSPAHSAAADTPASAVSHILTAVNLSVLAATPLLALHAAVLARAGTTLVVPGASGWGKSTLTAALLAEGWSYVSDEALALEWDSGQLRPYPRPLGLSVWSAATLGLSGGVRGEQESYWSPADLGADVEHEPGTCRWIVLPVRDDSTPPTLESVHRMSAMTALLPRGFTQHRDPARALVLLADLIRGASVQVLRLGPPAAAARLITERAAAGG